MPIVKNCPNCGSTSDFLIIVEEKKWVYDSVAVKCKCCNLQGPAEDYFELAIERWNDLPRREENKKCKS